MFEVNISKDNAFNVWFDDNNQLTWTRNIDGKLYTYRDDGSELGLVELLSSLSSMDNKTFKLLCNLQSKTVADEG